ncbi:hypothetical protein ACFX10_006857 [Malus domestica]
MVRSMMSSADLPVTFWGYALYAAAYLLNRVPSKSVSQTPYEMWHGRKPSLNHIKIWGCEAYVKKLLSLKQDQLGTILWDILEKLWDMSSTILTTKKFLSPELLSF